MRLSPSSTGGRASRAVFLHGLYAGGVLVTVELTLARLRAGVAWNAGLDPHPIAVLLLSVLLGLGGGGLAVAVAGMLRARDHRSGSAASWLHLRFAAMLGLWGLVVMHALAVLLTGPAGLSRAPLLVLAGATLATAYAARRAIAVEPGRWRLARALLSPWTYAVLVIVPADLFTLGREHLPAQTAAVGAAAAGLAGLGAALLVARLGSRFVRMPLVTGLVLLLLAIDPRTPDFRVLEAAERGASGPNVVLVTLDGVAAEHLSLYGYERETTPGLVARQDELLVFENAVSPATSTLASHASLFTGLLPSRHGAHLAPNAPAGRPLASDHATLAEELHREGYTTAGISANWGFLGPGIGLWQGFETFDARQRRRLWQGGHPVFVLSWPLRWLRDAAGLEAAHLRHRRAAEILLESRDTLRELRADPRPFFLFVNVMDAHAPYWPPAEYRDAFGPPVRDEAAYLAGLAPTPGAKRELDPAARREQIDRYDGAILYLDRFVCGLLDLLAEEGVLDDTLVIVTADHGEAFGEHGLVGHGVSTYEDQVHVPLVLRLPGTRETGRVRRRVSSLDVFPTVLELCGVELPGGLDAVSLLACPRVAPVVAECFEPPHAGTGRGVESAVYEGSWKAIASALGTELYDLSVDPGELEDRAGCVEREDCAELQGLVERAGAERVRPLEALGRGGSQPIEAARRLRAIGYTD